MSTDEENIQEDAALSQLTSKMPAPPPRAPSRSSARSSRRSSAASQGRKHVSNGVDGEDDEAPPTPSLSCIYNTVTLRDEISRSPTLSINTGHEGDVKKSLSSPKTSRSHASSLGLSTIAARRKSSRSSKEKEKANEPVGAILPPTTSMIGPEPASAAKGKKFLSNERAEMLQVALSASSDLAFDICEAILLVLTAALYPIYQRFLHLLASFQNQKSDQDPVQHITKNIPDIDVAKESTSLAREFKSVICSSHLLSKSLTISQYDQRGPSPSSLASTQIDKQPRPTSDRLSIAKVVRSEESATVLEAASSLLFDAVIVASFILAPICRDENAWVRSTVLLISLSWSTLHYTRADGPEEITFEVTHEPIGSFSLIYSDQDDQTRSDPAYVAPTKAADLRTRICTSAQDLIKSCQSFDSESNKCIALIQEVELVSRGFKLQHPFPPISRIEANDSVVSPSHYKSFATVPPQSAPAVINAASRLSQSSSSGASSVSGWKHLGSRPQSSLFSSSIMPNGRTSPQFGERETVRLAPLRKHLVHTFATAKKAFEKALMEIKPLVDEKELSLLEEMYELNTVSQDSAFSPGLESLSPYQSFNSMDRTASGTLLIGRAKMENEMLSSADEDSISQPATPQLGYFPHETYAAGVNYKARRRDSDASASWSVTSPNRETPPIRGGSRLGYISDKTPSSSSTPNQTATSKRLSYISSAAGAANTSSTQGKTSHVKNSSSSFSYGSQGYRKRMSLLNSSILDENKQQTDGTLTQHKVPPMSPHLIVSLKASFDDLHNLRRRFLCHLLALDITLKRKVTITQASKSVQLPTVPYLVKIEKVLVQLRGDMLRMAEESKELLQKEMNTQTSQQEKITVEAENANQNQDFTGMQDKFAGMGQALRSIQVKMKACSEELHLKTTPVLHGSNGLDAVSPTSPSFPQGEKSERILETIREDLLALSAEWEGALKILRVQQRATSPNAIADTSVSTLASTRLDSPQEAEEDAMRQWVSSKRNTQDVSDDEGGVKLDAVMDKAVLQWSSKEDRVGVDDKADLVDSLVKSASPDHLPPPGLEKVYESLSQVAENRVQRSILNREERIRIAKEQRAAKDLAMKSGTREVKDPSAGMIQELQAVMKNRKTDALSNHKIDVDNNDNAQREQSKSSTAAYAF